jgi:hypothetical protein
MLKISKHLTRILALLSVLLISNFYVKAQDASSDAANEKNKKIITEKEEIFKDLERKNQIRKEFAASQKLLNNVNKELKDINKLIDSINDGLIKSLDQNQINALQEKKKSFLIKKIELFKKMKEINIIMDNQQKELDKKEDNFRLADGTLNWEKTFDIKDRIKYSPGKWNLKVKALDNFNNYSNEDRKSVV